MESVARTCLIIALYCILLVQTRRPAQAAIPVTVAECPTAVLVLDPMTLDFQR